LPHFGNAVWRFALAFARRVLTLLIAVALALVPVSAAMAGLHAPAAKSTSASAHEGHATGQIMAHDHAAVQRTAIADQHGPGHCNGKAPDSGCCDDKAGCAQTCLQKCFGQMAVMPPDRTAQAAPAFRVAPLPAEWPPGWSSAPQPPPPRA
jgi:hypothetical protein